MNNPKPKLVTQEPLMTGRELCQALKISLDTLKVWRYVGKIEYIKLGYRQVRYPRSEMRRLIASHTKPAQPNCPNCGHELYCLSCDHPQTQQSKPVEAVRQ